ncbi:MAG TPA: hypothetical protein VF349_08530 [Candidatus Limnocylindrales bacterium]
MSPRKSDQILSEWLAMADSAPRPARAPRGNGTQQRTRSGLPAGMAATLLAAVVIAAVIGIRLASSPGSVGASQSAGASGSNPATFQSGQPSTVPSGVPSPEPSSVVAPTALASAPVTPVPASDWKSFAWSSASAAGLPFMAEKASMLKWSHGFAVSGVGPDQLFSNKDLTWYVWTSIDGVSWTQASGVSGWGLELAEGPSGLVAIGMSPQGSPETQTVWTSADGRTWSKVGTTSGLGHMVSLAGNSSTLVAVWDHSAGTDCSVNGSFSTETSTDGLHWTKVAQVAFGHFTAPPFVTSAGGRLFAMGPGANSGAPVHQVANQCLSTAAARGTIWWSDDGTTWHLAGGSFRGLPWTFDIGAHGLLLEGILDSVPGGYTRAYSTDGGQTWTDDQSFAPLGPVECTGECSSGPDGYYSSNGTVIVAVKSDGSKAWISSDARTWTQITWGGPMPDALGIMALPAGVMAGDQSGVLSGDQYGAGR